MNEKMKTLMGLAHESGTLAGKFAKAAREHIDHAGGGRPMGIPEFWPLVDALAGALIKSRGPKMDKEPAGKKVIEEFVRSFLFDQKNSQPMYEREEKRLHWAEDMAAKWETLARFVYTYNKVKLSLSRIFDKWQDLDMGDDGLSDMVDSFVLGGRTKVELILNREITTMQQLHGMMFQHPLERFIMRGENYITQILEETLIEKAPSVARDFFLDRRGESLDSVEKDPVPGVVRGVDLQAIIDALAPVLEKTTRPFPGFVQVNLTTSEHAKLTEVIGMLQLADLVNHKRAQDAYPHLLKAVKLVTAIADNPSANPNDQIKLATKTRAQLDSALKFAEK